MNDNYTDAAELSAKRLPELQAIATSMGIRGVRKLRKGELIEAIRTGKTPSAPASTGSDKNVAQAEQPARSRKKEGEKPNDEQRSKRETRDPQGEKADRGAAARTNGDENTERSERQDRRRGDRPRRVEDIELPDSEATRERRKGDREDRRDRHNDRGQGGSDSDQKNRDGEGRRDRRNNRGDGDDNNNDRRSRRSRGRDRNRNRNRRDNDNNGEPQVREDDVLVKVAGILDIRDNYAFVRTTGYLPGPSDIYVSMNQVRKYGLRKGDAIVGQVKAPKDGEEQQRQQDFHHGGGGRGRGRGRGNKAHSKFAALVSVDTVNGMTPEKAKARVEFNKLTPLYPDTRLRLENKATNFTPRIIDLVAPVGKGQRGLIVAPPKAGKTIILQQVADAITQNNPEVHLMVVLVDERPEEVTDMQRTVKGEVIASTFDRPADDHTTVAELAIERAKRLVEMGRDVVVLLDSITRLGRAYNLAAPASGRILSGGVDSSALYPPKRFFGAARNVENGGSLTILATALVDTGSKMDEVIFEEFKGTGNWELKLDRKLAERRIFPAVDVNASGTRREEELMGNDELAIMWKLRRVLSQLEQQQAIELLLERLKKSQNNGEFLLAVSKSTPKVPRQGE
ncbi:transcription termination factor Rho [Dermabacter sp. p3-SID358]|uniref:transcription termination factor Rho n=1 Tax=Dermabacter sp. p3-SID358 TaxID=2916114 RepID=UPI0021A26B56|nr:transcription termination factor Rho [Dermabacter sp. p3-SID358]MCT1866466.1 transcription termination factor Rho [Dermabacter sp. p3-SID358]